MTKTEPRASLRDNLMKVVDDLRQRRPARAPVRPGGSQPVHVAIIMDGNGRWASQRGLPRAAGHREGVEAARRAIKAARGLGLKWLTLYSFSTENWSRPEGEVRQLLTLLRTFIKTDLPKLRKEGVRVHVIGARDGLPPDILNLVDQAERETAGNTDYHLQIAFNYGGRDELTRAVDAIAQAVKEGRLEPADITEDTIASHLDTHDAPDPDLVIRTSGEHRTSNFLLWQAAYAEYVFLDTLWPDFDESAFREAIDAYTHRERRFGGRLETEAG